MLLRQPTGLLERWAWWERAIAGQDVPYTEDEPECGFYRVRKFPYGVWARGPWLPARVWLEPGEIDPETGELLSDEIIKMEIDGKRVNPWTNWSWIAKRPITETQWKQLKAMSPLLPKNPPSR